MRRNRADRPLTHARQIIHGRLDRWPRQTPDCKLEGEREILTHEETLQVLSEMARKGSVTAAVALKRVLRSDDPAGDFDDELARILSK